MSGPPLGRPSQQADAAAMKRMARQDAGERNAIEGKFGEGKRNYGLGRIRARLENTSKTVIALQLLVMNLDRRLRLFFIFFFQNAADECLTAKTGQLSIRSASPILAVFF